MAKSDLISKKALLKELRAELRECRADADECGGENILWAEGIEFAIDTVKQAKVVDVVEVVRCKDCHWYDKPSCNHPTDGMNTTAEDDFCSYGERRAEDGNL